MTEFWESVYHSNEKMWGEEPTDNAYTVLKMLKEQNKNSLLIPGFGYGRNAKVFHEQGIHVTGIEISQTAIQKARKHFETDVVIHHGSVSQMPFDQNKYDAIYAYSLIHLLNTEERQEFIHNCYNQLAEKGWMIMVALSTNDHRFGVGGEIAKNTFLSPNGLTLYFYDETAILNEFGDYNILQYQEIDEPLDQPNERHWMVICEK